MSAIQSDFRVEAKKTGRFLMARARIIFRAKPRKTGIPALPEEQAGPRARTTARHRQVTNKTESISTRAAHPIRNRPDTTPDERGTSSSLRALINAVAEIPTVSLLHRFWRPAQQQTTARARPDMPAQNGDVQKWMTTDVQAK